MNFLGNILWLSLEVYLVDFLGYYLEFYGVFLLLEFLMEGNVLNFASMSFAPFGKEIQYGGGIPSLFANIIWIIFFGIPMAVENFLFGCLWCITIVGIPFGLQFFKIAKLALAPYGAEIIKTN